MLAFACTLAKAQQIESTQTLIDCGLVQYRMPVTVEFELMPKGISTVAIKQIRTSCGCVAVDYPRGELSPQKPTKIKVTYDAKTLGHFEKRVAVYDQSAKQPLELVIRGVVVPEIVAFKGDYPFVLGELRTDKNSIEFDDVNKGDRPFQEIHVMNASDEMAEPQVMHLPDYLSAQVSPSRIAPGHAGIITLTLDSRRLRDFGLKQTSLYLGRFPGDKVSADKEFPVSVVLLPGFDNINKQTIEYAPKMQLSADRLDFEPFEGKQKGTIEITNTGRTDLEIRSLQMFTAGIEVSLSNKTIHPGKSAKLKITAIAKGLKKAKSKPRVLMITNAPSRPKVVISINVR